MAGNAGALARHAKPTLDAGEGARVPSSKGPDTAKSETDAPPNGGSLVECQHPAARGSIVHIL
jgi:hypothetical protein